MAQQITCDGCKKPLEQTNGWIVHAVYLSQNPEQDGLEIDADICEACLVKMKYFKINKK